MATPSWQSVSSTWTHWQENICASSFANESVTCRWVDGWKRKICRVNDKYLLSAWGHFLSCCPVLCLYYTLRCVSVCEMDNRRVIYDIHNRNGMAIVSICTCSMFVSLFYFCVSCYCWIGHVCVCMRCLTGYLMSLLDAVFRTCTNVSLVINSGVYTLSLTWIYRFLDKFIFSHSVLSGNH